MNFPISSNAFDTGAFALAGISHLTGLDSLSGSKDFFRGIQSFCVASCIERALRFLLSKKVQKVEMSLVGSIACAIIDNAVYSHVLMTQNKKWLIPRFAMALIFGNMAVSSIIHNTQKKLFHIPLNLLINSILAIAREIFLLTLSKKSSMPIIITMNSLISAFAEPSYRKNLSTGLYKIVSALFFRIIASNITLTNGLLASTTQHVFFNISRSLPF